MVVEERFGGYGVKAQIGSFVLSLPNACPVCTCSRTPTHPLGGAHGPEDPSHHFLILVLLFATLRAGPMPKEVVTLTELKEFIRSIISLQVKMRDRALSLSPKPAASTPPTHSRLSSF